MSSSPNFVYRQVLLGFVALVVATLLYQQSDRIIFRRINLISSDLLYTRAVFRFHVALLGAFCVAWLLQPAALRFLVKLRRRLSFAAQRSLSAGAITLCSIAVAAFIILFGRWQFGAFDHNILLELGWRQFLGQRPYVDFPTTSPPLFNLGMALAFRIFGVSWDGMLLFTALFAVLTMLWLLLLFRHLHLSRAAALGVAFTLEAATMLCSCFWWYNNATLLLAAILFLAAVLLVVSPFSRTGQISYVVALGLLALAKPNIAGVTILGCFVLLVVLSPQRGRVLLLSALGVGLSLAIFALAHISIPAMLAAYRGAAKERGAFSTFGFDEFATGEKFLIDLWYLALCIPLFSIWRPLARELRAHQWRRAAFWLFFPLAALIAVYGLRGNGELRDMETTVLVSAIALLAFTLETRGPRIARFTAALLCAMAISNLYTGITRDRVYTIGQHMFFEWQDRNHLITTGPLRHMRVSETFQEVNQEVGEAIKTSQGPFFFGPRVDYSYMAFSLPSPTGFPAWWHPGTAFDRAQLPTILAHWEQRRFPTLIFLKGDYTYYPKELMTALHTEYIRDDHFPRLTVYHRRPAP